MIDIDNDPNNLSDYIFLLMMTCFAFYVSFWFGLICVVACGVATKQVLKL